MDIVFAYETYYLILLHIFSVFTLLFVNFSIWLKAKKIPLLYAYLVVQGILLLWMISKILKTVAPDVQLKFVFVIFQYAGVCFLGAAFFVFAFIYAKGRLPMTKTITFMCMPPLLFLMALITNPYHLLFYSRFDFLGDSFGPVFYIHQTYNYILIGAGILLCAKNFLRQFGERWIQALLFTIAILIPLAVNIIYVFGWVKAIFGFSPPCDITPVSCNISLMMFALATFRYRFFDDIKIARRTALASIPDGILLTDGEMRIVDFNDTFKKLYENNCLHAKSGYGIIRRTADMPRLALYEQAFFVTLSPMPFDLVYETDNGCYYKVICRKVVQNSSDYGISLRFVDLTLKQALLEKMARKNEELSVLNEKLEEQARMSRNLAIAKTRNFIAGEVHDILGHSVVLVISLLEVARLSFGKSSFDLGSFIDKAKNTLYDCIKKSPLLGQPDTAAVGHSLIEKINAMISEVGAASIEVEFTVSGHVLTLTTACEDTIFKLCREGVTNAIRHGKAGKIDIILRTPPESIEVYVIDDGAGCKKVLKGMGITAMEERLGTLGGSLLCGPLDGHGFCLHAKIPVR